MKETIALHKTFGDGVLFFISNGLETTKHSEVTFKKWLKEIPAKTTIRFTAVHAADPIIRDLQERGHKVTYANWHNTGIERNLDPAEIVLLYAKLPDDVFRTFGKVDPRLVELRYRLAQRAALVEARKSAVLRLKGAERVFGKLDDDDYSEETKALLKLSNDIDIMIPVIDKDGKPVLKKNGERKEISLDGEIARLAAQIPDCVTFNEIAHIKGAWGTAATVVAYSGGMERFDSVAAYWHYCGEHVVEGLAPKRKKGSPVSWSPKLRTALWQMGDSIMKNRKNPWRDVFDQERAAEMEVHLQKHPGCKTIDGHCTARAIRKMRKEILKDFFLATHAEKFIKNHKPKPREVSA